MEMVIVISTELTNNSLPTFVTPVETIRAVVGMETVVSYNISDDDVTGGLSVVPVTMLPSGVSVDLPVELTDSIGECNDYYTCLCVCVCVCVCSVV